MKKLAFLLVWLWASTALSAAWLGDYVEDETVHFIWHSSDSSGASVTRSTDGTVSVYKDNGVAQSVAGVVDTEDFDSLTGVHVCTIDLSADAFYAVGGNYTVVLSAATIDSQTVNAVLAHFSIENRFDEVDVTQWLGTAAATPSTAGYVYAVIKDGTGTGELDSDSGTVLLRSATETQIDNIETDTAAVDTTTEMRTFLTGGDTAVSTLTEDSNIGLDLDDVSGSLGDADIDNDVQVDVVTIETADATDTINAQADTALSDYDATVPGDFAFSGTAVQCDVQQWDALAFTGANMVEDDGGTMRFTTNALEQAGGSGTTPAAVWAYDIPSNFTPAGTSAGAVLDKLTEEAPTLADDVALGSIFGQLLDDGTAWSYDRTADSLEIISAGSAPSAATIADAVWDEVIVGAHDGANAAGALLDSPADWATAVGFSTLTEDSNIGIDLDDVTGTLGDAEVENDVQVDVVTIETVDATDQLGDAPWDEVISGAHDGANTAGALLDSPADWATAVGFSTHDAADVRAEMDSNSTDLNDILTDTGAYDTDAEHAAAIWDADATSYQDQGSFGGTIGDQAADGDDIWALANTNLDAAVSSRSDFDETADPVELLDSAGGAGTSAAELQTDITGGAYALDTDANGRVRIVDGNSAGEINTTQGRVSFEHFSSHSIFALGSMNRTSTSASTTAIADTTITNSLDDYYINFWVVPLSGDNYGHYRRVTDYDGTAKELTVAPAWDFAQSGGTIFTIGYGEAPWDGSAFDSIPWNASWDAEVESEANDALVALDLDHLWNDGTAVPAVTAGAIFDLLLDDGTAVYDRTTDSLQAIKDAVLTEDSNIGIDLDDITGTLDDAEVANDVQVDVVTIETVDATDQLGDAPWDEVIVGAHDGANTAGALLDSPGDWITAVGFSTHSEVDVRTEMDSNSSQLSAIVTDTAEIGAAGAGLSDIPWNAAWDAEVESEVDDSIGGGTGTALTSIPWNASWDAEVESEAGDALVGFHLDHLFATDYDPASKPGTATALLNELVESDGGVSRYTANALELAPTGGTNPNVLVDTTIAVRTSQTVFTLTAGPDTVDGMDGSSVVMYDASDSDEPSATHVISSYLPGTRELTLDSSPAFTTLAGDGVKIFVTAPGTTAPTVGQIRIEMDTNSADLNDILADTADMQPKLGAPAADISADIAAVKVDTAAILVDTAEIGAAGVGLSNIPWNASWDAEVESEVDDALGVAGADLTAIPWNAAWDAEVESEVDDSIGSGTGTSLTAIPWAAAWDAEVQSEVDDALLAHRLDELLNADSDIDGAAAPTDGSVFQELMTSSASGFTWAQSTDSLQAIRDNQGAGDGSSLTAIPWAAAWDAEVQSEVNDGLVALRLDELLNADSDIDGAAPPTDGSVFQELMTSTTSGFTFAQATDSLEALRDNQGGSAPSAATIADAVWDEDIVTAHNSANTPGELLDGDTTGGVHVLSMADDSVTANAIATSAIGSLEIATDAIGAPELATDAIGALEIAASAITVSEAPNLDQLVSANATPAEVATELATIRLDELISADSDIDGGAPPTDGSIVHELMSSSGSGFTYDQTTDSLQALRDTEPHGSTMVGTDNAALATTVADIETDTQDIQGRIPAALSDDGNIMADVQEWDDLALAGANMIEVDGSDRRWTTNALEQAPGGGGDGSGFTAIPWASAWDVEVESEANDALVALHLDHLLAVEYDPASEPGVATALLNEMTENDGGVPRYTSNALEQGPGGGSSTSAELLESTTIASLATQVSWTLTSGSSDDDAYTDKTYVIITDAADSTQKAIGYVSDYTGATKTVTLLTDPGVFTMAVGDSVSVIADPTAMACWDVPMAAHGNSGSIGQAINNLMTAPAQLITVTSPVLESGTIELVQGDDYATLDGTELTFSMTDAPDLTSATVSLILSRPAGTAVLTVAGVVTTPTGDTKTVTVDLTAAQTTALAAASHDYDLKATLSSTNVRTLARGRVDVLP